MRCSSRSLINEGIARLSAVALASVQRQGESCGPSADRGRFAASGQHIRGLHQLTRHQRGVDNHDCEVSKLASPSALGIAFTSFSVDGSAANESP